MSTCRLHFLQASSGGGGRLRCGGRVTLASVQVAVSVAPSEAMRVATRIVECWAGARGEGCGRSAGRDGAPRPWASAGRGCAWRREDDARSRPRTLGRSGVSAASVTSGLMPTGGRGRGRPLNRDLRCRPTLAAHRLSLRARPSGPTKTTAVRGGIGRARGSVDLVWTASSHVPTLLGRTGSRGASGGRRSPPPAACAACAMAIIGRCSRRSERGGRREASHGHVDGAHGTLGQVVRARGAEEAAAEALSRRDEDDVLGTLRHGRDACSRTGPLRRTPRPSSAQRGCCSRREACRTRRRRPWRRAGSGRPS